MSTHPLAHSSQRSDVNRPRPDEVVTAMVALAAADSALQGQGVTFYTQNQPLAKVYPFCTVYRPVGPPHPADASRTRRVEIHVRFEVEGQAHGEDRWLEHLHDLFFAAVNGKALSLTYGSLSVPPTQTHEPTAAGYDADDDASYSTAIYHAAIEPLP